MWNTQVSTGAWAFSPAGPTWAGTSSSSPLPCTGEANEDYEDDYGEYDVLGDDPSARPQPVTPLQLFESRRSRRRREAPKVAEEQESRVQYTVCIWWVLGALGEMGRGRRGSKE